MKNKIVGLLMSVMIAFSLVGCSDDVDPCNKQFADLTYSFERAIIRLPNGDIIEGNVDSWRIYTDSDQIQVKIDGITYSVHSSNIVLIAE